MFGQKVCLNRVHVVCLLTQENGPFMLKYEDDIEQVPHEKDCGPKEHRPRHVEQILLGVLLAHLPEEHNLQQTEEKC